MKQTHVHTRRLNWVWRFSGISVCSEFFLALVLIEFGWIFWSKNRGHSGKRRNATLDNFGIFSNSMCVTSTPSTFTRTRMNNNAKNSEKDQCDQRADRLGGQTKSKLRSFSLSWLKQKKKIKSICRHKWRIPALSKCNWSKCQDNRQVLRLLIDILHFAIILVPVWHQFLRRER